MKKAFSILLLVVFLFNMGGYYLLFWVLKVEASQELSLKLDEGDYNENEIFEIKILITLPYPVSSEYERQTGQFVYQQEHYQMVKQKYEDGILTIICVKDVDSRHLANVMDSFSESSGDQPLKDGSLNLPIKVMQEFVSSLVVQLNSGLGWSQEIGYTPYLNNFNRITLATLSPPPWA